jgi:hypothetical protein
MTKGKMGKGEMAKIGGEMAKGELGKGEMGINPFRDRVYAIKSIYSLILTIKWQSCASIINIGTSLHVHNSNAQCTHMNTYWYICSKSTTKVL